MNINETIAKELNVKLDYVNNVVSMLDEGNTIPFIARYRKELHGSMDDTKLRELFDRLNYLRSLEERRENEKHNHGYCRRPDAPAGKIAEVRSALPTRKA